MVSGAALKTEKFSTANRVDERIKAPELRRISFAQVLPWRTCHGDGFAVHGLREPRRT